MNRTKKWIIAAAVLLVAGILICGITFTALGFDFSKLGGGDGNYETNTYEIGDEFHDISVQVKTDDVFIKSSEDGKCSVVCVEKKDEKHEVRVENGTLLITDNKNQSWLDFSLFDFQGPSVTVYLPENEYDALTLDATTGDVKIVEGLTFDRIHVEVTTGDIECRASAKNGAELKATTGSIRAEGFSASDVSLSVSTGQILASSLTCDGKVDAQVTTGDIKMDSISCTDVFSKGTTGDLFLKDVVASGEFHLELTTGDIRFDASDAGTIYAKTSTGDVTGTLLSDKIFITDTGTGDEDVPATTEGGKCEIKTSTGDISIKIQK